MILFLLLALGFVFPSKEPIVKDAPTRHWPEVRYHGCDGSCGREQRMGQFCKLLGLLACALLGGWLWQRLMILETILNNFQSISLQPGLRGPMYPMSWRHSKYKAKLELVQIIAGKIIIPKQINTLSLECRLFSQFMKGINSIQNWS